MFSIYQECHTGAYVKVKEQNENGASHMIEKDDYYVTIVFNNNSEKHAFMESIHKKQTEKFIKSTVLYDIEQGAVKLP